AARARTAPHRARPDRRTAWRRYLGPLATLVRRASVAELRREVSRASADVSTAWIMPRAARLRCTGGSGTLARTTRRPEARTRSKTKGARCSTTAPVIEGNKHT